MTRRYLGDMELQMESFHNHPIIYSVGTGYRDTEHRTGIKPEYGFVAVCLNSKPCNSSVAIYNRLGTCVTVDGDSLVGLIAALNQMHRQINDPAWVELKLNPSDKI